MADFRRLCLSRFLVTLLFLYAPVSQIVFQAFNCIDLSGTPHLRVDLRYVRASALPRSAPLCSAAVPESGQPRESGAHTHACAAAASQSLSRLARPQTCNTDEYERARRLAILWLIIYPIGVPLLCYYLLRAYGVPRMAADRRTVSALRTLAHWATITDVVLESVPDVPSNPAEIKDLLVDELFFEFIVRPLPTGGFMYNARTSVRTPHSGARITSPSRLHSSFRCPSFLRSWTCNPLPPSSPPPGRSLTDVLSFPPSLADRHALAARRIDGQPRLLQ